MARTPVGTYYIAKDEMERGTAYKLRARNIRLGVWDGRSFIGIRTK